MYSLIRRVLSGMMAALLVLGMGASAVFAEDGGRADAVTIVFTRHYEGSSEWAELTALAPDGSTLWEYTTGRYEETQLDRVNDIGVCGGTYYIVEDGTVVALDVARGVELWRNSAFGGSAYGAAFGQNGELYLSGYFGPDLFVVDAQGNTLRRVGQFTAGYMWPYAVKYLGEELAITYEMVPDGNSGTLYIDLDSYTYSTAGPSSGYSAAGAAALPQDAIASVTATSYLEEPQYGLSHTPSNLVDGTVTDAWVEGVSGQGEGQSVTISLNGTHTVSGLVIFAGYQKSDSTYENNSRPSAVTVSFPDGTAWDAWLQDYNGQQIVSFPHGVDTSSVTLTIRSVYPGIKYEDTVISEIMLY